MRGLPQQFDEQSSAEIGLELHRFATDLYPICRSITGNGTRRTLTMIGEKIPLRISEVATGTQIFDWTVPREWNVRDAYVKDSTGQRVIDFQQHNLHLLNYSIPIKKKMSLDELKAHLFTRPDRPNAIPYRTSYYKPEWGFCLAHNQMQSMPQGEYEVSIDTTIEDGHLTYGECFLPGRSNEEVLISVHVCHPSLANDNLSGLTVATSLARFLTGKNLRYSYRFLFVPGTIGAIAWLARNRDAADRVKHGLVLTCLGDAGGFHYKKSRRSDAEIDRAVAHVLRHSGEPSETMEFSPYGYDERQYCSPGFNLPVGCLMRGVWGTFPEYHTSADNLDFIHSDQLTRALRVCVEIVDVLENNRRYRNLNPYCEPQLGKRGLYESTGGIDIGEQVNARLWVLNFSDGSHTLLDIAEQSGLPFPSIRDAAAALLEAGLLSNVPETTHDSPESLPD